MGNYAAPWKNYAAFQGRATRGEYWTFALVNIVIAVVLYIPVIATGKLALIALPAIFWLAVIVPSLAVLVRRLHDSGRSGGWFFISLVPLIGGLWLLVLTLLDGTAGANQYGNNPRTA
jgi:uncharacterized membrane protein YhaH (DUF805 family)